MVTQSQLPGHRWLSAVQNPVLRIAMLTGIYLTTVMVASLFIANRVHFLEPFADARNAASYVTFIVVMLVPLAVFVRRPAQAFAASTGAWLVFTAMYWLAGMYFERLHLRFPRPFHAFVLGAILYGAVAVALWVASMAMEARRVPIAARRRIR